MNLSNRDVAKVITSWSDYKFDPRYLIILFLFSFVIAGQVYLGFFQNWDDILVAVLVSVTTEIILTRIIYKKWRLSLSPIITGLGVSLLLSSHLLWPYIVTAFLSILIKFLVQIKGGHIFNPNNVALVIMLFLLPEYAVSTPKQWTNGLEVMFIILLLGILVAIVAKRLETVLTYAICFSIFAMIRHLMFGAPLFAALGPLMGASLQLFIFFMITDPKTTPVTTKGRIIYAFLIASIDAVFRINQFPNPQFYALFLVCLFFGLPYRLWLDYKGNGIERKKKIDINEAIKGEGA